MYFQEALTKLNELKGFSFRKVAGVKLKFVLFDRLLNAINLCDTVEKIYAKVQRDLVDIYRTFLGICPSHLLAVSRVTQKRVVANSNPCPVGYSHNQGF